jgi:hypothetical protein
MRMVAPMAAKTWFACTPRVLNCRVPGCDQVMVHSTSASVRPPLGMRTS